MNRISLFILTLLVSAHVSHAQTSDQNAVKLLKSVSQKYSAYKTMQMDVSLTIENLESKSK